MSSMSPIPLRRRMMMALCCTLSFTLTACSGATVGAPESGLEATPSETNGSVAMFVPNDGFTISQNVPINTWNRFVDATSDALVEHGFENSSIDAHMDSDFDKQSRSLDAYVREYVERTDEGRHTDSNTDEGTVTLIVAPAVRTAESTKYYGDYATQTLSAETTDGGTDERAYHEALTRTVDALTLAKSAGVHVIVLSTRIPGFTPDVFVSMCDAEQIGRMQAQQLVNKLELDKTSKDNPKRIEIMLPFNGRATHMDDEQQFAHDAFVGAWSVLGTYFRSGVVMSPSLKLSAASTEDDWHDVAFEAKNADDVVDEIKARLRTNTKNTFTPIDGVVSMNDFVASGVVKGLADMGYVGTAADINPSITVGDVLGNIAGKHDVQRGKVPEPTQAPKPGVDARTGDESANGGAAAASSSRWPIITGYGAYVSNIPNIVDGKQWMTGLASRNDNAEGIATLCQAFDRGEGAASTRHLNTVDGVPTMALPLVAVSAGNLKTTLIDPGYISLADADL